MSAGVARPPRSCGRGSPRDCCDRAPAAAPGPGASARPRPSASLRGGTSGPAPRDAPATSGSSVSASSRFFMANSIAGVIMESHDDPRRSTGQAPRARPPSPRARAPRFPRHHARHPPPDSRSRPTSIARAATRKWDVTGTSTSTLCWGMGHGALFLGHCHRGRERCRSMVARRHAPWGEPRAGIRWPSSQRPVPCAELTALHMSGTKATPSLMLRGAAATAVRRFLSSRATSTSARRAVGGGDLVPPPPPPPVRGADVGRHPLLHLDQVVICPPTTVKSWRARCMRRHRGGDPRAARGSGATHDEFPATSKTCARDDPVRRRVDLRRGHTGFRYAPAALRRISASRPIAPPRKTNPPPPPPRPPPPSPPPPSRPAPPSSPPRPALPPPPPTPPSFPAPAPPEKPLRPPPALSSPPRPPPAEEEGVRPPRPAPRSLTTLSKSWRLPPGGRSLSGGAELIRADVPRRIRLVSQPACRPRGTFTPIRCGGRPVATLEARPPTPSRRRGPQYGDELATRASDAIEARGSAWPPATARRPIYHVSFEASPGSPASIGPPQGSVYPPALLAAEQRLDLLVNHGLDLRLFVLQLQRTLERTVRGYERRVLALVPPRSVPP